MTHPTVCVDFNGVLDNFHGWAKGLMNDPREGCEEFLRSLSEKYTVVILTAIDPNDVLDWLEHFGLAKYVSSATNHKPPALAYIDDRAICFKGNYQDALSELDGFKAYWETELPILEKRADE